MSVRALRWFSGLIGGLVLLSLVGFLPIGGVSEAQSVYSLPPETNGGVNFFQWLTGLFGF